MRTESAISRVSRQSGWRQVVIRRPADAPRLRRACARTVTLKRPVLPSYPPLEVLMPGDASAADVPATLAARVSSALESGDLDAIAGLLDPAARWGAPEGPDDADCRNREEVIAWWARARAAGARARVTEVTAGAGTLLVGLDVTGTSAARESGGTAARWQVLTVRGERIADIRGFDNRASAAARAGVAT